MSLSCEASTRHAMKHPASLSHSLTRLLTITIFFYLSPYSYSYSYSSHPKSCPTNHALFRTHDHIPLSRVHCTGPTPEKRRCHFQDIFVAKGVIWIIAEISEISQLSQLSHRLPKVLCSAVTKTQQHAKYCEFKVVNKYEMLDMLHKRVDLLSFFTSSMNMGETSPQPQQQQQQQPQQQQQQQPSVTTATATATITSNGVNEGDTNLGCIREMDVALAFGRLARANCYHSIFEDFIPIYETLTLYPELFSHWLYPNQGNSKLSEKKVELSEKEKRNMILFVGDDSPDYDTNYYTYNFWKRFFPHIFMADRYTTTPTSEFFFVKTLIAGSNSSCVHYYHCSRDSYSELGIAVKFRQYILAKVGISGVEQKKRDEFKIIKGAVMAPEVVTIIQRNPNESRQLMNIQDIVSICNNIFGIGIRNPCVVHYYSQMSLDAQILQTYSSDVVICVHGGALGNLLFAKNRSTVIDIYPYSFPYSFHGLMNWIRYSLSSSIVIGHSPFEIIKAEDMFFRNRSSISPLTPCLCNTTTRLTWFKCGFGKMFYRSAGMTVNYTHFSSHITSTLAVWKLRQSYPSVNHSLDSPPISKGEFKRYSTSFNEPWYYSLLRAEFQSSTNGIIGNLPDCSSHLLFRPPRRRRNINKKSHIAKIN